MLINLSTQLPHPSWAQLPQGTREQQAQKYLEHITHNQANQQLGLSDCLAKPIHNWVYQDVGNQANTLLGLSGYLAKPSNNWVY